MSFQMDIFAPATMYRLGHFHLDGSNLQMQTHIGPKRMDHDLAMMLLQLFYSKIRFIVLYPVDLKISIK